MEIVYFGKDAALCFQFVFDKKRHYLGETHGLFFGVSKACNLLARDQRLALGRCDVPQNSWSMAYEGDWLARRQERLDQLDGILVFRQIPQWSVATGIEDGIEVLLIDCVQADRCSELRLAWASA